MRKLVAISLQTRCRVVAKNRISLQGGECVCNQRDLDPRRVGPPMKLTLHVWRQKDRADAGRMETYPADDVSPDMSFREMLVVVNEGRIKDGRDAIAFVLDCREGIC